MISDGIDRQVHSMPDDPYVLASIADAVKAHIVVYAIIGGALAASITPIRRQHRPKPMQEVTQETGGKNFWEGLGNPVSFQPYFEELTRRLRDQYELGFVAPIKGKPEVESFKLKLSAPGDDVSAPQQVLVAPGATANP